MAAPLATLLVKIGSDVADVKKGVDKVTKDLGGIADTAKRIETEVGKSFGKMGESIVKMAAGVFTGAAALQALNKVASLVTATLSTVASALIGIVKSTVAAGDALFTMSQQTGISVEALSALKFIAGQTNTSIDTITGAVFKMQTTLGKGGEETAKSLGRLGLSLRDLRSADPSQAFTSILTKLGEIPSATQRATIGAQIFGKSFRDIAQLTQEDLAGLVAKAEELGQVMSTETAVAADRFGDALGELQARAEGFANRIGAAVLPGLIAFVESINDAFGHLTQSGATSFEGLAALFDAVVVQIGQSAFDLIGKLALISSELVKLAQTVLTVASVVDRGLTLGSRSQEIETAQRTLAAFGATLDKFALQVAITAENAGSKFGETFARIKKEIATSATEFRKNLKAGVGGGIDDVSKSFEKLQDKIRGVDLVKTAKDWAKALEDPKNVAFTFADRTLSTELRDALDAVVIKFGDLETAGVGSMQAIHDAVRRRLLPAIKEGFDGIAKLPGQFLSTFDAFLRPSNLGAPTTLPGATGVLPTGVTDKFIRPFRQAFEGMAQDLPRIIGQAIENGSNVLVAAANGTAFQFARVFDTAVQRVFRQGGSLTFGEKAAGIIAGGIQSFVNGIALGSNTTSLLKGGLTGALSGALAGANPALSGPTLGASILVGAGVGLVGGLIGASQGKKQERLALQQARDAFTAQFGGMEKLRELSKKAGFDLNAVFNAKKPEDFQRAVAGVNEQLAAYNKHLQGITVATDGVNKRTALFATQFRDLVARQKELQDSGRGGSELDAVTAKIAEVAQRTQPEFERLGLMVRDTFAALVKESGDAFGAIVALAPSFQVLKEGVTDFGLTSTAVIDELLKSFNLINDDTLGPFLQNVQASGEVLKGLFDAKALSPEGFQAIAADIGQSLQEVANRGGDMSRALALSQPILQTLFEAQQRFGLVTDQTTQSILKQAQEQGLIGDQMKDVNRQILDVLIAIADVFGAKIPAGMRKTLDAAEQTATDVEQAFKDITINPIELPVHWKLERVPGVDLPDPVPLARGGIVRRPTLALVGESGPEAVVPLSHAALGEGRGSDGGARVIFQRGAFEGVVVDSEERERSLARRIAKQIQRGGDVRAAWRDAGVRVG